jgi:DNA-binding NarL/FixJ family response regulator
VNGMTEIHSQIPEKSIPVLIMAEPGGLLDGLAALISVVPYVDRIEHESSITGALRKIAEYPPGFVLLDADLLGDNMVDFLISLKNHHPEPIYFVLASDVQQEQLARSSGVDEVLLKGFPAEKLLTTIEALLKGHAA